MDPNQGGSLDLTFLDELLGGEGQVQNQSFRPEVERWKFPKPVVRPLGKCCSNSPGPDEGEGCTFCSQMVPVDDIFPLYVDELNSRSKRHAAEQEGAPVAKHLRGAPRSNPAISLSAMLSAPTADMHSLSLGLDGSFETSPTLGGPGVLLPSTTVLPSLPFQGNGTAGFSPHVPLGGVGVPAALGSSWLDGSGGGDGYPAAGGSSSDGGFDGESRQRAGQQGVGTGRRISKKKQESNKAAQQRYREKKKAQFSEMEEKLEQLTQQLARMEALEQRNQMLEMQNTDLEKKLMDMERENDQLKLALDRYADATSSGTLPPTDACQEAIEQAKADSSPGTSLAAPSGSDDAAHAAVPPSAENGSAACASCVSCEVLPRDLASGDQLREEVAGQVARLREFLAEHKLHAVAADSAGAEGGGGLGLEGPHPSLPSSAVLRQLVVLVGRSCQLCQAAIKAEGVRVLDLVDSSPGGVPERVEGEAAAARWRHVLRTLRLNPAQAQQLLLLRQAHLGKMRAIYKERQGLNVQAMSLMLPQAGKNPFDEDAAAAGGVGSLSGGQYLSVARSSAELGAILDQIKDNLRREQRAVMDMNCVTVSRILTPLQAAIYMVETYPQHCDALALSNMLALESTAGAAQQGASS